MGGFVARRLLKNNSRDYIGLSYFDSSDSHYFGVLGQAFMLDNNLKLYSEIVKQDVGTPGQDATAVEFEIDFENEKVIFLNETENDSFLSIESKSRIFKSGNKSKRVSKSRACFHLSF